MLWSEKKSPTTQGSAPMDKLVSQMTDIMAKRLRLMPEVAMHKWNHDLPVFDQAREEELLNKLTQLAMDLGIAEEAGKHLLQGQMDVAKNWQELMIDQWRRDDVGKIPNVRDLQKEIRPEVGQASKSMLELVARLMSSKVKIHQTPSCPDDIPPKFWDEAFESLKSVVNRGQ